MILDQQLLFDSAFGITTTIVSTNVIDLTNPRDMGFGDANGATPKLLVLVGTAFTSTNSATLQIQFQGSTDNSTYSTYAESRAYAATSLTAGAKLFNVDLPARDINDALPRYYRLNYVVGTGIMTTGTITAAIVLGREDAVGSQGTYPSGFTVAN